MVILLSYTIRHYLLSKSKFNWGLLAIIARTIIRLVKATILTPVQLAFVVLSVVTQRICAPGLNGTLFDPRRDQPTIDSAYFALCNISYYIDRSLFFLEDDTLISTCLYTISLTYTINKNSRSSKSLRAGANIPA